MKDLVSIIVFAKRLHPPHIKYEYVEKGTGLRSACPAVNMEFLFHYPRRQRIGDLAEAYTMMPYAEGADILYLWPT